jgi:hypothetical protein
MRKINLKAKNLSSSDESRSYSGKASLIAGSVLLLLAAALYGGVFYLKSSQVKKMVSAKNSIQSLKNSLDSNKEYKELYDFQDRLLEIKRIFKDKVAQVSVLDQISGTTMNENTFKGLKMKMNNGKSDITVNTQIADLNLLAKQLKAYSRIDMNKRATLDGSSLGEDGVDAVIELSIGNLGNTQK